jgi:hypothetical protein
MKQRLNGTEQTEQSNAMQCNAMQCNAMQCNAMQCKFHVMPKQSKAKTMENLAKQSIANRSTTKQCNGTEIIFF